MDLTPPVKENVALGSLGSTKIALDAFTGQSESLGGASDVVSGKGHGRPAADLEAIKKNVLVRKSSL